MFRDLKEYQDITKIYQDSVHISEEERIITQIIREENFTQEELDYVIENFDEIYDNEVLTEEFFDEMEGEYLEEMAGGLAKKVVKTAIKKVVTNPTVRKVVSRAVPGLALAGGLVAGGKKLLDKRNQAKKDAAIEKQVDDYVEKRKNPDGINKVDPKQFDSR